MAIDKQSLARPGMVEQIEIPLFGHIRVGQIPVTHNPRTTVIEGQSKCVTFRVRTSSDTVRAFDEYMPRYLALPHPSWRSKIWMKKNPWFEKKVLPKLRRAIKAALL